MISSQNTKWALLENSEKNSSYGNSNLKKAGVLKWRINE